MFIFSALTRFALATAAFCFLISLATVRTNGIVVKSPAVTASILRSIKPRSLSVSAVALRKRKLPKIDSLNSISSSNC